MASQTPWITAALGNLFRSRGCTSAAMAFPRIDSSLPTPGPMATWKPSSSRARLKQGCVREALGDQISALKISECWHESAGITASFAQECYDKTCTSGQERLNLYTIRVTRRLRDCISLLFVNLTAILSCVCCTDTDVMNTNPASFAIIKLLFSAFCLFTLSLIYCSHWHCYHAFMFVMLTTLVLPT